MRPDQHGAISLRVLQFNTKLNTKKDKGYNSTIKKKDLPYGYMSLTFGTFGSFGEGTWRLITKA
eukprot:COSAG06_NODE_8096_length_2274_cov_2.908506_3_plen_63_part_01